MRPWRGYVSRGWPSAAARPPVPSTALTGCGKTPERLRFAEHSAANAGREKVAKGYCWQISWCVLRILYPQAASRQTPGVLCRRSQQLRQPDPVVGGRRQREHPVHPGRTAEVCLSLPADRFDPAERLFNPLAQDQTEGVARMPRGAPVNGGGAVLVVLCHVRGHVEGPHVSDEAAGVEQLVSANGDAVLARHG